MADPLLNSGPLTDNEAQHIREFVQRMNKDNVPPEDLRPLVVISPQLHAVAVAMGAADELTANRHKLEAILHNGRSGILVGFADLLVNGKRFTGVMAAFAAFGGTIAVIAKLYPHLWP